MRASSLFLLIAAVALTLPACTMTPPGGNPQDATIFKRPHRYGWGSPPSQNGPTDPGNNQQRSGNRFGHTGDAGQGSGGQGGPGQPPSGDSVAASTDGPDTGDTGDTGAAGGNTASTGGPSNEPPGPTGGPGSGSGGSSGSSSTPPSNLNAYPYARLVPGKKGFVTLPGKDAEVGEIDVTGIKPGTPVEIDDPRDPSKKIYFRVP